MYLQRRHVWDVIERVKQDRAVVLTTHSMEEADILGDKVGIMAKGQLRCLGTSMHLKEVFGSGYQITVTVSPEADRGKIKRIFAELLSMSPQEETSFFVAFTVPTKDEQQLTKVLQTLEEDKEALGIKNIQIGMSSLEDVFLSIAKSVGCKEGNDGVVTVSTCTGESVVVRSGMDEPFRTPQGHVLRPIWSIDAEGNMACVNTIHLSTRVQLEVEVPAGHVSGSTVPVKHGGQLFQVAVTDGIGSGETFTAFIDVPVQAESSLAVDDELSPCESDQERDRRVLALASSYASQSKAMFRKTASLQMKRRLANCCLCSCPAITLAIMFMAQLLIESLFIQDAMAGQRCTYCGPSNDDFGRAYCAGMDCADYFWQVNNKRAQKCSRKPNSPKCQALMDNTEISSAKEHCREIAKTCGGKGQLGCFWPQAAVQNGSLGKMCSSFSVDPLTMQVNAFSEAMPLSFAFSPANNGLKDTPLVFTAPDQTKAQQILDQVYKDPFTSSEMSESAKYAVDAMYTLLMLPGLGCGYVDGVTRKVGLNSSAFPASAQAAICQMLQHGQGTAEPCCLDLSKAGNQGSWSDADGTLNSSGVGLEKARTLLAKISDQKMSDDYFSALDSLQSSTFACVRPAYSPDLEARLPKSRVDLGLEEGFAVIAQVFSLPEDTVHAKTETSAQVPTCTASGTCQTPHGRWAQTCDLAGVSRDWASIKCGPEARRSCSAAFGLSSILSSFASPATNSSNGGKGGGGSGGGGSNTEPPCLCAVRDMLKRWASVELGVLGVDSLTGRDAVVGLPRLPGGSEVDAHWATPRMSITDGPTPRDGNLISVDITLQSTSNDWWNWDQARRFGECSCQKEVDGRNETCERFYGPGCDENNRKKCKKDRDCECKMNVFQYDLATGTWHSQRSDSNCQRTSQKRLLISDNSYGGFALQVADCSSQAAAVGILHKLSNLTGLRFECTSMAPHVLSAHREVDDVVYKGFYSPYAPAGSKVQGVAAAFVFKEISSSKFQATVMHNTSQEAFPFGKRGQEVRVHTREDRVITVLNSLLRSYISRVLGKKTSLLAALKSFPGTPSWGTSPDIGSAFGPFLITTTFLVLLPSIVVTHVQEKVSRIRIMMKMMGLGTSAYWLISYVFWFAIAFVFAMVFMLLANVCSLHTSGYKIGMFQNVDAGIQFVFFLLYTLCLISFALLLSTLAHSVRSAQVGTILFVVVSVVLGSVFEGVGDIWESDGVSQGTKTFISLFPSMSFYRAMVTWRQYSSASFEPNRASSLTWSDMSASHPMGTIMLILALEALFFMLLALYLDQVWGNYGAPQPALFCLGLGKDVQSTARDADAEQPSELPHDVAQEWNRVQNATSENGRSRDDSVVTRGLRKVYPGGKVAVKSLSVGVTRGSCFGMLGPNGAGKTTTINMLTGFATPTSGDALVEGFSINKHMRKIYTIMGVCPQHDILWETLSPREHLTFYGSLKNLKDVQLTEAIEAALRNVDLLDVIDEPAGTFSGGMKRRLSVAISLIGMPLVCYLDEPSTGLDPANRRLLWDCIKRAKKSRSIILTTHSMQEAEGLCDRLTIFLDGAMECVGDPKELTMRYSAIYNITVTTAAASQQQQVAALMAGLSPSMRLTYSLANTSKYEMSAHKISLFQIFQRMLQARAEGHVVSWAVSSTTLEDAFIKICRDKSVESAY